MDRPLILELARLYSDVKPEKERSPNVMLRCPLASMHASGGKGSPSFSVEVKAGEPSRAHCFSCEVGGSLAYVFEFAHNQLAVGGASSGLEAALAFVREHDKGDLFDALAASRVERAQGPAAKRAFYLTPAELLRYTARCRRAVPQYLVDRGFTRGDVEKWHLGMDDSPDGWLANRATFPIWNETRELVGVTGRSLPTWDPVQAKWVEERPKYKDWPPAFAQQKTEMFYGEHLIDPTIEEVTIVEGPPATIFAARVLPNVLGLFGATTGITAARFLRLRRWAKRITFMLDGDGPGRDAVLGKLDDWNKWHPGLREQLQRFFVCLVATLPEGKDPADLPGEVVVEAKKRATYLFDFVGRRP